MNIIEQGIMAKQKAVLGMGKPYLAKCAASRETAHLSRRLANRNKYNPSGGINEVKMTAQEHIFTEFISDGTSDLE